MSRYMLTIIAVLSFGFAGILELSAEDDQRQYTILMSRGGCRACHQVDKHSIGPAYKAVAEAYRKPPQDLVDHLKKAKVDITKQQEVLKYLVQKVRTGTKKENRYWRKAPNGNSYVVMTPASPKRISDEDLEKLVKWILALKQ